MIAVEPMKVNVLVQSSHSTWVFKADYGAAGASLKFWDKDPCGPYLHMDVMQAWVNIPSTRTMGIAQ